jgi:hypothetical protein
MSEWVRREARGEKVLELLSRGARKNDEVRDWVRRSSKIEKVSE